MQQGTNFYYNAWQPIQTNISIGTKAPYYGSIAAAAMIGDTTTSEIRIANIPLTSSTEAAYAAYANGSLARIAVINMQAYNATVPSQQRPSTRGSQTYLFSVSQSDNTPVKVRSLLADGSDATTGISFDGYSYDYQLKQGMPVLLSNITRGQTVTVKNGIVNVQVMDSSAVILDFT